MEPWKRVEGLALWSLENANQLPPREVTRGMAILLRHWRYPRSGDHVSWSLILPARDYRTRRALLREVAWDRLADWKRMNAPLEALKRRQGQEPSLRVRDAELGWEEIEPSLRRLGGVSGTIPPSRAGEASKLDAFGLQGFRSLAHVTLRWTGKGPRSWSDALSGIGKLRSVFVKAMRERDRTGHDEISK
ncbi:MAG TPA: hypothetical protein VF950_22445 [Planctomycetota bacterium]